jgi:hypothetical protein
MPPPEEGTATTITGLLNIPASSGQIPAVVITHGVSIGYNAEAETQAVKDVEGISSNGFQAGMTQGV